MKPLNDEVCTTTTALHCVCMWYQKWRKTRSVFYNWWLIFSQFYVHPLHFMIDDRKFEKCCIWAAQPSALILDTWSRDHAPHHQPTLHAIRTLVILTFLTPSSRNFAPNMPSLSSSAILILLFVIYFRSFIVKQKFFGATRVLQHIITEGVHCCEKLVLLSLLSGVPNQSIILTSRAAAGRKKVLTEHVTDSTVFIISDILCTVFIAVSEPPPRTDSQHGHGRQQWW